VIVILNKTRRMDEMGVDINVNAFLAYSSLLSGNRPVRLSHDSISDSLVSVSR
jgi:hypothetical protein